MNCDGLCLLTIAHCVLGAACDVKFAVPLDDEMVSAIGADSPPIVRRDRRGAVIALRGDGIASVGVGSRVALRGDFSVVAAVEHLAVGDLPPGKRAGVSLYVQTKSFTGEAASFWWQRRHASKGVYDCFLCERVTTDGDGKRRHRNRQFKPAGGKLIRLRLAREGSLLKYSVAEGGSKQFRELHQEELGDEDITQLRFVADRGDSDATLQVRFLELHVKADAFGELPPARIVEEPRSWSSLALWVLCPLAVLATWLALRQRWRDWARPPY